MLARALSPRLALVAVLLSLALLVAPTARAQVCGGPDPTKPVARAEDGSPQYTSCVPGEGADDVPGDPGVVPPAAPEIPQSTGDPGQPATLLQSGSSPAPGTDPLQATGEFVHTETDVRLPGQGMDFVLERTYRSRVRYQGNLGHNWAHSYEKRLYAVTEGSCGLRIDYEDGHLGVTHFRNGRPSRAGTVYDADPGVGLALEYRAAEHAYVVRDGTTVEQIFAGDEFPAPDDYGSADRRWRPLTQLRDLLGNQQNVYWAGDADGDPDTNPRVLFVMDTGGRVIFFQYDKGPHQDCSRGVNVGTDYYLTCVSLEPRSDCAGALVTYTYDRDPKHPTVGELIEVSDSGGVGFTYGYDDVCKRGTSTKQLLGMDDVVAQCNTLCGTPAQDCKDLDICADRACEDHANYAYDQCLISCLPYAVTVIGGFACDAGCLSTRNNDQAACPAQRQATYPFCVQSPSPHCSSLTDCVDHFFPRVPPGDINGDKIYGYGALGDLNHNLTTITDLAGHRVLRNVYGGNPTTAKGDPADPKLTETVAFDRVIDQYVGDPLPGGQEDPSRHVCIDYHDLDVERQIARSHAIDVGGVVIPVKPPPKPNPKLPHCHVQGALSPADPTYVKPLSSFGSVDICPHGAFSLTLCPQPMNRQSGAATAPQLPTLATVTTDMHGVVHAAYLDSEMRTLREVTFTSLREPLATAPVVVAYATTDYNYREHAGGTDVLVLHPDGNRTFLATGPFNRVLAREELPAPGKPGDTRPQTVYTSYDTHGQPTGHTVATDLGESHLLDHIERDPATSRVLRVETFLDDPGAHRTEVYAYAPSSRWYQPSFVTHADGSVTLYDSFKPSSGGPEIVTADAFGPSPLTTVTNRDGLGRVMEVTTISGNVILRRRNYGYVASTGRVSSVDDRDMLNAGLVNLPWHTAYDFPPGAPVATTATTPERIDAIVTDGAGQVQQMTQTPKDTSPPSNSVRVRCFDRAEDGRLHAEMEAEGSVKTYAYDPAGRQVQVTQGYPASLPPWAAGCQGNLDASKKPGDEIVSQRSFTPGGFPTSATDGSGVGRRYETDGRGRIVRATDANGNQHWTGYDLLDRVVWEADFGPGAPATYGYPAPPYAGLARMTEHAYDLTGRRTSTTRWKFVPGDVAGTLEKLTSTAVYDDGHDTVRVTGEGGEKTIEQTDAVGRAVHREVVGLGAADAAYQPDNTVVVTTPSPAGTGTVTRVVELDSWRQARRGWDGVVGKGELLFERQRDPQGRVVGESGRRRSSPRRYRQTAYSQVDVVTRNVDPSDANPLSNVTATTATTYDRDGRRVAFADGDQNTSTFGFDGQGRLVSVIDGASRTTTTDYFTGSMRVAHIRAPGGTVTSDTYQGSLLREQDVLSGAGLAGAGHTLKRTFGYDALGHVTRATLGGDFDFPTKGSTVTRVYDSIETMVLERESSSPFDTRRSYDPRSRHAVVTWGAAVIDRRYDARGRISEVDLGGSPVEKIAYAPGDVGTKTTTLGDGTTTTWTRDEFGLLTDSAVTGRGGASILQTHVGYGVDGEPRLRTSTWAGIGARSEIFEVDGSGRVRAEGLAHTDALPPAPSPAFDSDVAGALAASPLVTTYSLDGADNWRSRIRSEIRVAEHFTPDGSNAYTTIAGGTVTLDALGNEAAYPAGTPLETFSFDGAGELIGATGNGTTSAYGYDALGRRVLVTDGKRTRRFVWEGTHALAVGTDPSDPKSYRLLVDDGFSVLALVASAGAGDRVFLHSGWDGSTLAATSASGDLLEAYAYSAYGETTVLAPGGARLEASAIDNPVLFQGRLYDATHGLYWMGARAYKPVWGRFLSPDPIGVDGGQNAYAFAGARPTAFTDPTGLDPQAAGGVAGTPFGLGLGDFASRLTPPSVPGLGDTSATFTLTPASPGGPFGLDLFGSRSAPFGLNLFAPEAPQSLKGFAVPPNLKVEDRPFYRFMANMSLKLPVLPGTIIVGPEALRDRLLGLSKTEDVPFLTWESLERAQGFNLLSNAPLVIVATHGQAGVLTMADAGVRVTPDVAAQALAAAGFHGLFVDLIACNGGTRGEIGPSAADVIANSLRVPVLSWAAFDPRRAWSPADRAYGDVGILEGYDVTYSATKNADGLYDATYKSRGYYATSVTSAPTIVSPWTQGP